MNDEGGCDCEEWPLGVTAMDIRHGLARIEARHQIEALNYRYARLIDAGNFVEFAELFAHGTWRDRVGRDAVLSWLRENVRLYDGLTRTSHLISALEVEVDGARATGRSTITIFHQPASGEPITVMTVNDYDDRYGEIDGEWRFLSREVTRRLEGDMTPHLFSRR